MWITRAVFGGAPTSEFDAKPGPSGATPNYSVRRERRGFSVGESPTRQVSFQPVAIGTVVYGMRRSKLPMERVLLGLGEHAGRNVQ